MKNKGTNNSSSNQTIFSKDIVLEEIERNPDLKALINVLYDPRTINYSDSKDFNINEINEKCRKYPNDYILVIVPNTKGITSDMIKQLNNRAYIRISGAYDDKRLCSQKDKSFISKKSTIRSSVDMLFSTVIYSKDETVKILQRIEEIESKINSKWSNIQKLVYLDNALVTKLTYDPEFENKSAEDRSSLRGLISNKTVCAGYSIILQELLSRQDIKCYFVAGNGHAWNIVEIEDKLYGVDLTYENTKYRLGMQNTYIYLGQNPSKFNETHRPSPHEPNRALHSRLCKLDNKYLKFIASTVINDEDYERISFKCQRKNKQEFVLMQIGVKEINNTLYYIYYYDNLENGKPSNYPLILTSKETISKYVDNENFNKGNIITSADIVEKLFSIENIADSLNRGSSYIGELVSYKGTNSNITQLKKDETDLRKFNEPPKVFPRYNNTPLVVEKDGKDPLILNDMPVYKYNAYDIVYKEEKPVLRKRTLYSDTDILYSTRDEVQTRLLSEENISSAINNNSGYIGYLSETGEIVYNNELMKYFNSLEGIKIEDFEKGKRK